MQFEPWVDQFAFETTSKISSIKQELLDTLGAGTVIHAGVIYLSQDEEQNVTGREFYLLTDRQLIHGTVCVDISGERQGIFPVQVFTRLFSLRYVAQCVRSAEFTHRRYLAPVWQGLHFAVNFTEASGLGALMIPDPGPNGQYPTQREHSAFCAAVCRHLLGDGPHR